MARAGRDRDLKRAVRPTRRDCHSRCRSSLSAVSRAPRTDPGSGHGLARAFLGDLAADHHAPGQGQVDRILDGPLGPVEQFRTDQIGLPVGSRRPRRR